MSYLFKLVLGTKRAPATRGAQFVLSIICFLAALSLMGGGSAFAGCSASLSSTSLAFPAEAIGNPAPVQKVILSNGGTSALSISSIAITGVSIHDFKQTNTCGSSVAAGGSCTVSVTFSPTATGSRYADVTISDNAPASPQNISVTGTGTTVAGAALSTGSLAFPAELIGNPAPAQTVSLWNSGSAALTISSIAITGVSINDFTETNTCGSSVAPGATCTITVTFSPTDGGSRYADVTVADNAPKSPQNLSVTGTGARALAFSPPSLTFPAEPIGTPAPAQSLTLSNPGSAAATISSIAVTGVSINDFKQTNNCGSSLAAGASCTISVTFSPTASGSRYAGVTVTNSALGSPECAAVTGTGETSAHVLSISPASIAFGNQPIADPSAAETVTITNASSTTAAISDIAFTGTNAADFAQVTTCGASLGAGSSCTVAILMTPAAAGAVSGFLTITDNASGSPQSVALSGTGLHNVVLSWSAASGATGYNVYRGTASGGESSTPLNSSPVSGTGFCDLNVQAGQTYYYVVTSVSGESQSAKSAQASVVVPTT